MHTVYCSARFFGSAWTERKLFIGWYMRVCTYALFQRIKGDPLPLCIRKKKFGKLLNSRGEKKMLKNLHTSFIIVWRYFFLFRIRFSLALVWHTNVCVCFRTDYSHSLETFQTKIICDTKHSLFSVSLPNFYTLWWNYARNGWRHQTLLRERETNKKTIKSVVCCWFFYLFSVDA